MKQKKISKKDHWLDYADEKYSKKMISDVKAFCRVVYVYLPIPIFWALYDQQGKFSCFINSFNHYIIFNF